MTSVGLRPTKSGRQGIAKRFFRLFDQTGALVPEGRLDSMIVVSSAATGRLR
ncbi:MAG TPA: hypothetical protein VG253_19605 [Streptosporangiaceae bacterium]|nr:hypothetical protein [Streptosporangiaceae bacterium]